MDKDAETILIASISFLFLTGILIVLAETRAYPVAFAIMFLIIISSLLESEGVLKLWTNLVSSAAKNAGGSKP